MRISKPTALFLTLMLAITAGERPSRLTRWSRIALAAATAGDVATSYGKPEANPLLRGPGGNFGARGVSIKLGIVGAAFLVERVIVRRHPEIATPIAITNLAGAAMIGGVAARNARIPR
jgi:hypothetical protein